MATKQLPDKGHVYGIILAFAISIIWNLLNMALGYFFPLEGEPIIPHWRAWSYFAVGALCLYMARQAWLYVVHLEKLMATHPILGHHFRKKPKAKKNGSQSK